MIDYIGYFFVTLGALLTFFATLSAVRFHIFYARLNAFVKFASFGTACLMLGVLIFTGFSPAGIKAILCFAVFAATIPVQAQLLARYAAVSGIAHSASVDKKDSSLQDKE